MLIKDKAVKEDIIKHALNCFSYTDKEGSITEEYPFNPNGSELNYAGLIDKSRQILGMMPHPNWGKIKRNNPLLAEEGMGLKIFKNIVEYVLGDKILLTLF